MEEIKKKLHQLVLLLLQYLDAKKKKKTCLKHLLRVASVNSSVRHYRLESRNINLQLSNKKRLFFWENGACISSGRNKNWNCTMKVHTFFFLSHPPGGNTDNKKSKNKSIAVHGPPLLAEKKVNGWKEKKKTNHLPLLLH